MDPQVQRDREAFMRAVAARVPEWTARKAEIDALCGCLQTMEWGTGAFPKKRSYGGRVEARG